MRVASNTHMNSKQGANRNGMWVVFVNIRSILWFVALMHDCDLIIVSKVVVAKEMGIDASDCDCSCDEWRRVYSFWRDFIKEVLKRGDTRHAMIDPPTPRILMVVAERWGLMLRTVIVLAMSGGGFTASVGIS